MMHSLIKYSVMEVQKILNHEIMDTLNEHTEALMNGPAQGLGTSFQGPTLAALAASVYISPEKNYVGIVSKLAPPKLQAISRHSLNRERCSWSSFSCSMPCRWIQKSKRTGAEF